MNLLWNSSLLFGLLLFDILSVARGRDSVAVVSIQPEYILLVKDEPVNISCVVKSKSQLTGSSAIFSLEHISGNSRSQIDFDMISTTRKTSGLAIDVKNFAVSSSQSNNVEYQAIQNVTVVITQTGQLTARCAGDSNALRTWTVVRVLRVTPTPTQTNMTCAFALPKDNALISVATVSWQLPPTAPAVFNATTSCDTLQAGSNEVLVCSTVSLVPIGMTPTKEALLRLAGRYWCSLVKPSIDPATTPSTKQSSYYIDFLSTEIEVRKCFPTTGTNCVADSRCAFRCQVYGWPFKKCSVEMPATAKKDQVKSLCRFEDMVVEVVLDPAFQSDAGVYNISVMGSSENLEASLTYQIRVKDKLAPLWPFLGICGEVFVLCGIIFFFEKRHRKRQESEQNNENSPSDQRQPLTRPSGDARQRITAR